MNREAFEFLYIHANCLAELAIDQLALDFESSMPADPPDVPPLTGAEREEQALALLGAMDMSAVADGWKGGADFEAQVLRGIDELKAADSNDSHAGALNPALNLDFYLQGAYAARGQVADRVDNGMARLDMATMERLFDRLPGELAPLTNALNADELAQWLACYLAGNAALDEIVTLVRGADTSA